MSEHYVHPVPMEARRGHWVTWNWSLERAVGPGNLEPGSSGRSANALMLSHFSSPVAFVVCFQAGCQLCSSGQPYLPILLPLTHMLR